MKLKNRYVKFVCLCIVAGLFTGCASLYDPYALSDAGWKETPALDEVLADEADEDEEKRQDVGLTEENYQTLHEDMTGMYAYDSLSTPEKLWYLDMYRIMKNMGTEVALYDGYFDQIGVNDIDKIFQCVMSDHPEFFYVEGYTYTHYTQGEKTVRVTFSGTYTMDEEEAKVRQEQIDAYVEECLAGIPAQADEYEKTKYIYEYLISNTEYQLNAPENQNICSVFIGRKSVCQGYAKATQYLLNQAGVFATLVVGQVNDGQGHAWNLVRIDGKYYYVDTTWGDASYQRGTAETQTQTAETINYDYLCVTTEQLVKTHRIENIVEVPLCRDMDANYYVKEGAYFLAYDEETLQALFEKETAQGRTTVTLKCGNSAVYKEMFEKLIDGQEIFRYMNTSADSISYAKNDIQMSLTFWQTVE